MRLHAILQIIPLLEAVEENGNAYPFLHVLRFYDYWVIFSIYESNLYPKAKSVEALSSDCFIGYPYFIEKNASDDYCTIDENNYRM